MPKEKEFTYEDSAKQLYDAMTKLIPGYSGPWYDVAIDAILAHKKLVEREVKTMRKRTHPGEVLREEFLNASDDGRTLHDRLYDLANHGFYLHHLTDLVLENRDIDEEMAIKLGTHFHTTPEYWMNLQKNYDNSRTIKVMGNG